MPLQRANILCPMEEVTICDHLGFLAFAELQEEVFREAVGVAPDRLVERAGLDAIESR